ncbi:MAG: hypothetical protein Q9216_007100, partial [Gyalolechia sp. 2 TL-2023]
MDDDCANALWLGWLQEWLEDARTKSLKSATTSVCDRAHDANSIYLRFLDSEKPRKRTSGDLDDTSLDMTPAKKPRKATKPYVPQLRSGPYAILLALVSIGESEQISKQQLIELAQPHCDASFVAPKDTTSYHTAWSSMKTLLNKDLVKETRGPQRRYSLTDEGWEVAEKMKRVGEGELEERDATRGQSKKAPRSKHAEPSISHDFETGISTNSNGQRHRAPLTDSTNYNAPPISKLSGQRFGGAVSDKYGTVAPSTKNQKHTKLAMGTTRSGVADTDLEADARLAARLQVEEHACVQTAGQDYDFVELLSSPPPEVLPQAQHRELSTQSKADRPSTSRDSEAPRQASLQPKPSIFTPPSFRPITIQPSTFTIELILDVREIRSREDRTYIETQLLKKGIRPLIRSLPLGDFFWVAKCHDPDLLGRYGEEGDEIALDYIVERKRLDDLISSIKDGRFHEQKFRLRRSGVQNVIYLIEEIGISQDTKNKYWAAVQTAIASTQVIDGFTVKRTRGLDESIRYLARMTELLKSIYATKPLTLIPSSILSPQTYTPLLAHLRSTQPDTLHKITYPSFASLASKSDNRTLRDVFLHMLMTTKGLTGDKAIAIQQSYPTPRALVAAFAACKGTNNGDEGKVGKDSKDAKKEREEEGMMVAKALQDRGV